MAGLDKTCMLTASDGLKIGVIGLIEKEWCVSIKSHEVQYQLMLYVSELGSTQLMSSHQTLSFSMSLKQLRN